MQTKLTEFESVEKSSSPPSKVKCPPPPLPKKRCCAGSFGIPRCKIYLEITSMKSIFWYENVTGIETGKTETKTDSALEIFIS